MNTSTTPDQFETPFDITDDDVVLRSELMNRDSGKYHTAFDFHVRNLRDSIDKARAGDEKYLRAVQLCAQSVYETAFRMTDGSDSEGLGRIVLEEFRQAEQLSENFEYIRQRSESIRNALLILAKVD